ncbi:MAG: hypothetical protein H0V05_19395 [Euzebyaceae bacterium]|nr:hypothetical protein [Euzebyaceae bacterium]
MGDVAFDGTHAYTADGHTGAWLANLERLTADLNGLSALYPGHGKPGRVELLAAQRTYVLAYREAVRDLADGGSTLNDDAKRQREARMAQALPGAPLGWLVPLGADAVAAELATEAS